MLIRYSAAQAQEASTPLLVPSTLLLEASLSQQLLLQIQCWKQLASNPSPVSRISYHLGNTITLYCTAGTDMGLGGTIML